MRPQVQEVRRAHPTSRFCPSTTKENAWPPACPPAPFLQSRADPRRSSSTTASFHGRLNAASSSAAALAPATYLPIHLAAYAKAPLETLQILVAAWPECLAEVAPRVYTRTRHGNNFVIGALPLHLAVIPFCADPGTDPRPRGCCIASEEAVRFLLRSHPDAARTTCEADMAGIGRLTAHIRNPPASSPYIVARVLPIHLALVHGALAGVVAQLLDTNPPGGSTALDPCYSRDDCNAQSQHFSKTRCVTQDSN